MADYIKNNKPYWLPQVNAPFTYVVDNLKKEEIPYSVYNMPTDELKPLQKDVNPSTVDYFKGIIKSDDEDKSLPIFVSGDNEILDGHNRYVAHSLVYGNDKNIKCFKLECDSKCAARILNKIQDKYEFENISSSTLEPISKFLKKPELGWFDTLEDISYICYRKKEIMENSQSGNFFFMQDSGDMKKYRIEFEKIMFIPDKNKEDLKEFPQMWVVNKLFPNKDFNEMAMKSGISVQTAVNREIVKKLKQMGYDGINYCNYIIQTI